MFTDRYAGVRRSEKSTSLTFKVSLAMQLVSEYQFKLSFHYLLPLI